MVSDAVISFVAKDRHTFDDDDKKTLKKFTLKKTIFTSSLSGEAKQNSRITITMKDNMIN